MNVRIEVRAVGQSFAVRAAVRSGHRTIHETRLFPHGYDGNAYQAAYLWAANNGHTVIGVKLVA